MRNICVDLRNRDIVYQFIWAVITCSSSEIPTLLIVGISDPYNYSRIPTKGLHMGFPWVKPRVQSNI